MVASPSIPELIEQITEDRRAFSSKMNELKRKRNSVIRRFAHAVEEVEVEKMRKRIGGRV